LTRLGPYKTSNQTGPQASPHAGAELLNRAELAGMRMPSSRLVPADVTPPANVRIGSTKAASRAGNHAAINDVPSSIVAAAMCASGPSGLSGVLANPPPTGVRDRSVSADR
jgi:hypothetical protein